MNKTNLLQSLGITAFLATGIGLVADMNVNLPLVGVAVAFLAVAGLLALAAAEPRRDNV